MEGVKTYRDSEHPCPNCKTTLLYRHFFSKEDDLEVNQCSKCAGFWVDAGGLAKIILSKKKEKKELIKNYFSVIMNEKIPKMNLANQDIAEAAELIALIFKFLIPPK
ncbi:zf-TFIIB domain-containing protein [Nitrospinae bacterium]|nr:zf-TFIIB domain-containing protein [Nitrospinota bacterium]